VLDALSIYELNRFAKFVNSPYFNQNQSISLLLDQMTPFLKKKGQEDLTKEALWSKVFGEDVFDDVRFRKLNSELLKLFEQFLAQEVFDNNPLHQANNLVEGISAKKIEKLYNSVLSSVKRLSERQLEKPAAYYFYQYQLEKNQYNLTSEFEKKFKKKTKYTDLNIEETAKFLDIFYLGEKLKLYCMLLSWQDVTKIAGNLLFMEEIIQHVEKLDYSQYPPIAIYYQVYKSYSEPDKIEHFYKLKELISKYIDVFPIDEAKDIFGSAHNFCIRRINIGQNEFVKENLDLYKESIAKGIMFHNEEIPPNTFRNIVISAVILNDFEWAEDFIRLHKDKLEEKYRDNAVTFNLARIAWAKKDHTKVIRLLQDVEFNEMVYDMNSKIMLVTTYFDTDEIEPLYSLLDSFKIFIYRNNKTITDAQRVMLLDFIKFVRKIMAVSPGQKTKLEQIGEEIKASKITVTTKQWLLEKVEELK
jgi:hypothetical protein